MREKRIYWLWLQAVLGPCSAKVKQLVDLYGFVEKIYEKRETPQLVQLLSPGELQHARTVTLEECERLAARCDADGIAIVCYNDEAYPERLRYTRIPPAVLYVTGNPKLVDAAIAIAGVGARFSTQYGRDAVKLICAPLAQAGIPLVSGLAYGIDAEVHKAALQYGGPTVAVLGTAIDVTYPANHKALREQIERSGGAVVSEYAPGTVSGKQMFSQRNRIISGLSQAVIIFEAAKKSGTMITATWALDDGRDVFAVPGSIFSAHSEGTNYLIKQGAIPAHNAQDILEALDIRDIAVEQMTFEAPPEPELTGAQRTLYEALADGQCSVDALTMRTGLAPHVVLAELTALEMDGLVAAAGGSQYRRRN